MRNWRWLNHSGNCCVDVSWSTDSSSKNVSCSLLVRAGAASGNAPRVTEVNLPGPNFSFVVCIKTTRPKPFLFAIAYCCVFVAPTLTDFLAQYSAAAPFSVMSCRSGPGTWSYVKGNDLLLFAVPRRVAPAAILHWFTSPSVPPYPRSQKRCSHLAWSEIRMKHRPYFSVVVSSHSPVSTHPVLRHDHQYTIQ